MTNKTFFISLFIIAGILYAFPNATALLIAVFPTCCIVGKKFGVFKNAVVEKNLI